MQLDLSKLGSKELKALFVAVKEERERRGKKNPSSHEPPLWAIPKTAINGGGTNGASRDAG